MYFEQFYLGCLAHASYLLGSDGVAAVVDPQRDIEIYLQAAAQQGLRITHIFETHLHADFVSGHKELAARTGAQIYIGAQAGAKFPHVPLHEGDEIALGRCRIRVLETPGHTLESTCLVVTDPEKSPQPWAALTGDTLFIGDVGRPDLSPTHTPQQLAGLLYDSLHEKLLTLPDGVMVYPAHGAGSLCGRNMRAERFSTIGTERLTNYALKIATREGFIRELTTNLPVRPDYFAQDAAINRDGAPALVELPLLAALTPGKLLELQKDGAVVLDTRAPEQFVTGHVPGAINIGLGGQFASWAATALGLEMPIVLVAESDDKVAESRMRLARVGIESVLGFLQRGMAAWRQAGKPVAVLTEMTAREVSARFDAGKLQVLDVRREGEWQAGHVEGAHWEPLDNFRHVLPALDKSAQYAVHCKGGYRSVIACSMLMRAGYRNVINIKGGFDAWVAEKLPVAVPETVGK